VVRNLLGQEVNEEFAIFWAACRRKTGKLDAQKAYAVARRTATAADILAGLERYHANKPSYADYCHPATFLRKGRWLDEAPAVTESPAPGEDLTTFEGVMTWLGRTLGLRVSEPDFVAQMRSYRRVLRAVPVADLLRGAETWAGRESRFPRPAQWRGAVRESTPGAPQAPAADAQAWLEAERQGFEAPSCTCAPCVASGADWRPLRFVPDVDRHGATIPMLVGTRQVARGHWAHGEELVRWWVAQGKFWEAAGGLTGSLAGLPAALAQKRLMPHVDNIQASE
jgi:hypothetical protein